MNDRPGRPTEQVSFGLRVEAVASGKPIVSTDFPHVRELLSDGVGIVVPHDDITAMAEALASVILHSRLAACTGDQRRSAPGVRGVRPSRRRSRRSIMRSMAHQFFDRTDAGRLLGERLLQLRESGSPTCGGDVVVVGLPRGGVPVAREVARALDAPLDVIVVRKVGVPHQPELAMGAVGEDGVRVVDDDIVRRAGVGSWEYARAEAREMIELRRRADRFRRNRRRIPLDGRDVIIVDDGLATGSTMLAACAVARAEGARRILVAVPVAPIGWLDRMGAAADDYVCLSTPELFLGVGGWYRDFTQVSDEEVVECLGTDRSPRRPVSGGADGPAATDRDVSLDLSGARVGGHLTIPARPRSLVIFAHGSGSSRHSPRNRYVADVLLRAGHATLLFDLLTPDEEADRQKVFDIELLARRLADVTRWAVTEPTLEHLPIGYFGASTGAAAALRAASEPDCPVRAIVSRGGRPDLAGPTIRAVRAPTLLIVGGRDTVVIGLNKHARTRMRAVCRLEVVPGAGHLFEEPGTLATAAHLTAGWFDAHLAADDEPVAEAPRAAVRPAVPAAVPRGVGALSR